MRVKYMHRHPRTGKHRKATLSMCAANCTDYRAKEIKLGNRDIIALANIAARDKGRAISMILQLAGRLPDKKSKQTKNAIEAAMLRTKPFHTGGKVAVESTPMFGMRPTPFLTPLRRREHMIPNSVEPPVEINPEDVKRGDKVEVQMSGFWPDTKVEKVTRITNSESYSGFHKRTLKSMADGVNVPYETLAADFSQIEVRVMAHWAQTMASKIFDVWLMHSIDRGMALHVMYAGHESIQERLDEEGCAEMMAAIKQAEGVWDD